jgi:DNA-binding NarL/FixJ family response regulator
MGVNGKGTGIAAMLTSKSAGHAMPPQNESSATRVTSSSPPTDHVDDVNAICRSLTVRQRDVLALMMQGKSNKAICRVLNLAEQTVKNHVSAILKALKATSRTEAVVKVSRTAFALLSSASEICGYRTFRQN